MLQTERRESSRREVVYQIAYECFNAHGEKMEEGTARTVNISGRGALIEMYRNVDLDASLILWIQGPFHLVLVKGEVLHSRLAGDGMFHVGVRVLDVIEGTWKIWERIDKARVEEEPW